MQRHACAGAPGLAGIAAVAAGVNSMRCLALKAECAIWGDDFYGERGDGTTRAYAPSLSATCNQAPAQVANLSSVVDVASGGTRKGRARCGERESLTACGGG